MDLESESLEGSPGSIHCQLGVTEPLFISEPHFCTRVYEGACLVSIKSHMGKHKVVGSIAQ